jgi:uncharacterized protein (DUF39 family)
MDPLLDDTVFMGTKWMMAGADAVVRLYSGAHHGFNGLKPEQSKEAERVNLDVKTFISDMKASWMDVESSTC